MATPPSRSSPGSATGRPLRPPAPSPTTSASSSDLPHRRGDTPVMTATLFHNVQILDSTGADPYPGDVLVEDDRIAAVGTVDPARSSGARVIEGRGRTLMSGLCDAHTHFSWN